LFVIAAIRESKKQTPLFTTGITNKALKEKILKKIETKFENFLLSVLVVIRSSTERTLQRG